MIWVAGLIGALGLVCIIYKRTLLGLLVGIHMLGLGSSVLFVFVGLLNGLNAKCYVFALFIILGGLAQLVVGYALGMRLFLIKKNTSLDDLQGLRG